MGRNKCPRCGAALQCLGGCSAHESHWYCSNETTCGWQAWNGKTKTEREAETHNYPACAIFRGGLCSCDTGTHDHLTLMKKTRAPIEKIDVRTKLTAGSYIASGGGQRVSCTMDAAEAVRRLAIKLWGEGKHGRCCLGPMENGVQRWQIARAA